MSKGTSLLNSTREKTERVGRMVLMHANTREEISEAYAGDIVALVGLKDTRTGDTLCDPAKPVILEKMDFPDPVIEMAVEPKTKADQEKMGVALHKLATEDPSFRVSTDRRIRPDHHQGHGRASSRHQGRHPEAHPQGRSECRRPAGGLSRNHHPPGRSRLHPQEADRRFRPVRPRQIVEIEPNEKGKGYEFESKVVGGSVPKEFIPGVEKGLNSVMTSGMVAGFPVVDVKVALVDGAYHEVDSSAIAFEIAARAALREALAEGGIRPARADHEGRGHDA